MVLAREDGAWKIKAIHWSSRQRRWGPLHRYTRCEGGLRRRAVLGDRGEDL